MRTTTVPQLVEDHFVASGIKISASTVKKRIHNAGIYARRSFVRVPLNGRHRSAHLRWARELVSWIRQQLASVVFTDESRLKLQSDSGHVLVWREQGTRYNQLNIVERHSFGGGGIMVWVGISVVTLTCMYSMEKI